MYRFAKSSNQASYRSANPLTNDEIARYAPSVLADHAHQDRAATYGFIPTIQTIEGLRQAGFLPYEVRQTRVRDQGKKEFTKHMVRLRAARDITVTTNEVPEIILLNSHDGTSSYQLMAGYFRFVCSNGLIAGSVCDDIRIRHNKNVVDNVIDGCTRVLDNIQLADERIDAYKGINLTEAESTEFAKAALQLRWDDGAAPITPDSVLRAKRWEDRKPDLWTTFNRIQENMVRGGVRGHTTTGKRTTTREVGGVNENVRLNKSLWTLADAMAQLKTGVATPELQAA
jgi:hypothetical protein